MIGERKMVKEGPKLRIARIMSFGRLQVDMM